MFRVTLIPGDGIGPEITTSAVKVIEAAGVKIDWEIMDAGLPAIEKYKDPLPKEVLDSIQRNMVALKGPVTTPVGEGFKSVNVALRQEFDLYANVRPIKSIPGIKSRYENVDLVIIRENTEGFYSGLDHNLDSKGKGAVSIGIITRTGSERIARYAFDYALSNNRKMVTAIHKANILKFSGGLFLNVMKEVSEDYKEILFNDKIIDATAMQLVVDPSKFDVIVTTNLFGDIISDLAAGLIGGLGLAPGGNFGFDISIFEAVHGSAPDIAGKNIANPTAIILASVMMLRRLRLFEPADKIEKAIFKLIGEGKYLTKDLNPEKYVGTKEFTDRLIESIS
jgi:isocitrate dehydrogenase (NAD+)